MIDFAIIGAQKAATSSLHNAMRMHPKVEMPRGESPMFESPEFMLRPWAHIKSTSTEGVLVGIKRPNILCSDIMRDRIMETHPELKIIVVLREPLSRSISAYYHLVRHAELPLLPLNEGIQRCIRHFKEGRQDIASLIIEDSLYGRHLQRWYDRVSPRNILVLSQKQVSENPQRTLNLCLEHIGLHDREANLSSEFSSGGIGEKNVGIYDFGHLKLARITSLIRTRPLGSGERRVPRSLPFRTLGGVLAKLVDISSKRKNHRADMLRDDVSIYLEGIYKNDEEILRKYVPEDVLYWHREL